MPDTHKNGYAYDIAEKLSSVLSEAITSRSFFKIAAIVTEIHTFLQK